ncbi:uncharacterized protein LOC119685025 [Teleopsis dalmanni]|uniref:uncharacterized protein LOC119685025 n=1 Tax=Teleopsis dalmanni TaxID=139649 RepID=UPI0018CF48D8|nr:uncharacterized protein LOC119685025 [Teleopsis dalmanni]
MRAFIVVCLLAAVYADNLGYNYQPVDHSSSGLSFVPGGGAATQDAPSYAAPAASSGLPSYAAPALSSGSPSYVAPAASSGAPSYAAPGGELQKEFFTYSANDEDFHDGAASDQINNALKQSLRVIFIKGPENNALENAALNLAKAGSDRQTAIYVLQKQADIGDLANKLNNINNQNSQKPEVHFVKYRTPEDAANAQHAIQSQYDSLGGPSHSHHGGVAPVINFASPATSHQGSYGGEASAPSGSYLPPSVLRSLRL